MLKTVLFRPSHNFFEMPELEEFFAIGDELLVVVGLLLLFTGNLWGLLAIALGIGWMLVERDFRLPLLGGEAKKEIGDEGAEEAAAEEESGEAAGEAEGEE